MRYLTTYKIFESQSVANLIQDIKNVLLEFSDNGVSNSVSINNHQGTAIMINIGGAYNDKFYLDTEMSNALIRIINMTEDEWTYNAFFGNPNRSLYIYGDDRRLRSSGKRVSREYPFPHGIGYIQIFLYKKAGRIS